MALCSHNLDHAGAMASAERLTAWQATQSIGAGACWRHRSKASGQRGLKAQPGGGSIGLGISPLTGIRWRPDIARSIDPPPGCAFNPRCPLAFDLCRKQAPALIDGVACHAVNHPTEAAVPA